jgi:protein-disulfide isomerase
VKNIVTSKSAYAGLGEDYRKGSDSAKVTVVEFSDFECPACARAEPVLREVIESMGSKILFVFRNYPLDKACNGGVKNDMHKFACQAAVVGRCAGQFGKFWQFHDKSFAEQDKISLENIKSWGRDAGLTASQIDQCLASNDIMAKIKDDIAQGDLAGVTGTPAIFINGKKYAGGLSVAEINAAIQSELSR